MNWLNVFRINPQPKSNTAALARERLQIVVAHQRNGATEAPEWLPKLQKELVRVIRRYVKVEEHDVSVDLQREGSVEVLELSINMPEG